MSNEDHIERAQRYAVASFGKERTAAQLADDFALYSRAARIEAIANLKTPDFSSDVRRAAKRLAEERSIREMHTRLEKAGR